VARYRQRWGDPDAGDAESPPAPSASTVAGGAALGLVPFALVALAFWAVFAPPDSTRTSYRGRKH
jgi:hypothetical protein